MSERDSYYGQPVIKEPIWSWEVPLYFYTGGLAGASAALAYGAELGGDDELARRAWLASLAGIGVSPLLLISDLGKPARFLNMLRMFKVTSPMSVGTWILSGAGAAVVPSAANAWLKLFPRTARVAKPAAALLGLPLSTYTAALVANTAVPAWHEARRELPFVFAGGAAASAGAAALALTREPAAGPARRLAVGGSVVELVAAQAMERRLGDLGEPYKSGKAGRLARAAKALTAAGAACSAFAAHRSRPAALAGSALIASGALCERYAVFYAGVASAADPKYTVAPQRERIERGERTGAARRQSRVGTPDAALASPATSDAK